MAIANMELEVSVRSDASAEQFARIAIKTDQILSGDTSRAFRFTIIEGGRQLWQQWFDHKPIYVDYEGSATFEAQIAAFPTNPRTDYGYIRLVRKL